MSKDLLWRVNEGSKINLRDYDPDYTAGYKHDHEVKDDLEKLGTELSELQEIFAAAQRRLSITAC
jgi:hypothetical protein